MPYDDKLSKIESKLDKIQDNISAINSTLAAQHESLKIHIKRTDLLEKKLEPVERHVIMINGILKFIGVIAVLATIAEGIMSIKNG